MTHDQLKKGVKIIFIALIALIVLGIINSFINEIILRNAFHSDSIEGFSKARETTQTISNVFNFFGLLVKLVVLYGAFIIYKDSSGISEKQSKNSRNGLVLLCIWVVLLFLTLFLDYGHIYFIILTMVGIAYAIGIYLLVMEIAPKFDRYMLLLAMASILAAEIFDISNVYLSGGFGAASVLFHVGRIVFIVAYIEIYVFLTGSGVGLVEGLTGEPIQKKKEDAQDIDYGKEPAIEIKEKEESFILVDRILKDRTKEEVITDYAEKFNITLQHAGVLFTSGYYKIEDLKGSSVEELLIIDDINPTVARKIVNYFKD